MKLIIFYLPEWLYGQHRLAFAVERVGYANDRGLAVVMFDGCCDQNAIEISQPQGHSNLCLAFCFLFKHVMLLQNDALTALT